ncbi:MAG: phosphatase PAP2 family protein [Sphingomicrobium sp.]
MSETSRIRAPSRRVSLASALLALLWLAMLTVGTGPADDAILRSLYAGGHPALIAVARGFTFLGEAGVLIALAVAVGLYLWAKGRARDGLVVVAVTLVGRGLVEAQKYGIARLRPIDEVHLVPVSTPSFPSGHSASSVIVYLTLALVLASRSRWKWAAVAAALALSACIGLSRIMLGVHWPTDVIGGWTFGLLWVLLALPVAERLALPRR